MSTSEKTLQDWNLEKIQSSSACMNKIIMIVDDEMLPRFYARKALEKSGYEIIEAMNGEDAVKLLKSNHVDAVLLDINMPGMNGYETCQYIRDCIDDDLLPIIVVTGHDDHASIETAYAAGATDFTAKPVNWPILTNRLNYLFGTRQLSHDLKLSEQVRSNLIDAIPDTILQISDNGRLLGWKHGSYESGPIFSFLIDIGKNGRFPDDIIDGFYDNLVKVRDENVRSQLEFKLTWGQETCHYEMQLFSSHDGEVVAMVRDITQRYHDEEHIRNIAFYDPVTDLPNLSYIEQELEAINRRCKENSYSLGVVRIELLRLDYINSVHGKEFGNELLHDIASRIKDNATAIFDTTNEPLTINIARVNGPGFIVILEGMNDDSLLLNYIGKLGELISTPFLIDNYEIEIDSQIGASFGNIDENDDFGVLKKADLALAEAQKTKTNAINLYTKDTHTRTLGQFSMAYDLRRAIENGDLHLEYQPKISIKTGSPIGAEALIRWHDEKRGRVMPDMFIPLAEESSLILTLGEFVLHQACLQSQLWRNTGFESMPIAINLSARQFNQHGLVDVVRNSMSCFCLDEDQLEVEMTETSAIENSHQLSRILNEFREHGIKTAIDDFGSGYTSLSSLRNFNFDTLKIDRSIVQHVCNDNGAAAITKAIINMGHELNMNIVAEGVEEQKQFDFLEDKGCDVIQGYLTGRPVSVDDFQQQFLSAL